jgi:hypothetical protein
MTIGSGILITGTDAKTINLGSSTITCAGATSFNYSGSNATFNAGTSTINCSPASPTFAGGGLTFYNVSFTSAANGSTTITGANTFNNLTQTSRNATGRKVVTIGANQTVSGTLTLGAANTAVRRIYVSSDVIGTQRTITLNGTLATLADVDFRDIATAGSVGTWTGTRIGNALNNSGITFTSAKTVYWNLAGTQNWSSTGWATTNNGTPAVNNFPLPQDTATFTEAGAAGTVTIDLNWWTGAIQMADGVSNRTTAFTLAFSTTTINVYKNVTLFSNLIVTSSGGGIELNGQGTTQTIASAGVSFGDLSINSPSGTVQLTANFTSASTVTLSRGTLDLSSGNRTLTCNDFNSSTTFTRSILFGTGNITVTGNNKTVVATNGNTGLSYTGTPRINLTYSGSTGTRFISSTNPTLSNAAFDYYISAGSDIVDFQGNGQYGTIDFTGFSGTFSSVATSRGIWGSLVFSSGMTVSASSGGFILYATSGTQKITSNGKTLDLPLTCSGVGGTVQLQDNLTIGTTRIFTLTNGTLDLTGNSGNWTLSTGFFSSANSNTRSIAFGTGNITLTGGSATIFSMSTATNFTYTGTSTVNATYTGSVSQRSIFFGGTSGGTETNSLNFNISAGTDSIATGSGSTFKNLNFTGFSGTLLNNTRTHYGNLILSSGMTLEAGGLATTFAATSGTQQITTNGNATINFPIIVNAPGATVQLQDNLNIGSTRTFTLTAGTFNSNNYNVSCGAFSSSNSNTRVLTMGSSQWTLSSSGWDTSTSTGLTVNAGTSIINMNSTTQQNFAGGGKTYYILKYTNTGNSTVSGNNTFYDLQNSVQPLALTFTAGSTNNFTGFSLRGTAGNLITLRSSVSGTAYTFNYL